MMRGSIRSYFTVILLVFISTLIIWLPFILRSNSWFGLKIEDSNFLHIYKHYDGPLYVVAAKTLYDPSQIERLGLELNLANKYFAAHLPFYPFLIRIFSPFLGYLKSMVFVNLLFATLLALFLYVLLKKFKITQHPVLLIAVFLFLPRFLVVRSVGAPESLFIFLILLSLYFFEREKMILAGVFGGLAAMTKTPGVLLFVAYFFVLIEKFFRDKRKFNSNWLWVFAIPLGLVFVFSVYWLQYGDFFAYFNSGDNIHLVAPFSIFNFQNRWVGTAWLEDILFFFFLYLVTVITLWKSQYRSFFYFGLVFLVATFFIQHRDIARYSLPLWPLALIANERFFTSKKFLIAFIILLPAIYLYAWNLLVYNVMPISDWKPYL